MGKPNANQQRVTALRNSVEQTWGSETSQYPEEKKTKFNSLSSGERKGKSPNLSVLCTGGGCKKITSGVILRENI